MTLRHTSTASAGPERPFKLTATGLGLAPGAQGAVVEGEEIDFLDADISGAVLDDCVVAIEQQLEGQLEDGTPYSGSMFLTAAPDPDFDDVWSTDAGGYVAFNWNGGGCQNTITGTIISISPAN